jgi:hypothetical protein
MDIKKIIQEELDGFDWTDTVNPDVPIEEQLHDGAVFRVVCDVDGKLPPCRMKLQIMEVREKHGETYIDYIVIESDTEDEPVGDEFQLNLEESQGLINRGYWVYERDMSITESEFSGERDFDWTGDVKTGRPVKYWNGGSVRGSNSPMNDQVYIYTDSDGDTHSLKVGGVAYKHRTRRYDGTYFSNDGEISFYDSSITQDEIDQGNNDVDYDPFDGKTEIEMSRKEFNEFIDQGRLTLAPVNESNGFEWTDGIDSGLVIDQTYEVTADNGYKYLMVYCGRGTTTHPDTEEVIDGHRFRDTDSIGQHRDRCNSWWSEGNLLKHIKDGSIKLHHIK